MLSITQNALRFQLSILDLEFENPEFQEDQEWLVIKMEAHDPEIGEWHAQGPFLRKIEIQQLSQWLKNIAETCALASRLCFLENELAFEYDKKSNMLSVLLDFDFHPKGKQYEYGKDQEYCMDFHLTKSIILKLSRDIDQTLAEEKLIN